MKKRPLKWWQAYVILPDGIRQNWCFKSKSPELAPKYASLRLREYHSNYSEWSAKFHRSQTDMEKYRKKLASHGITANIIPVQLEEFTRQSEYFREIDGRDFIIL